MTERKVLIIGAGVAGLTAARALAEFGIAVDVVEQHPQAGGHAARLSCKATDRCVKCGACLAAETLATASAHPGIRIRTSCRVTALSKADRFVYHLGRHPPEAAPAPGKPAGAEADAVVLAAGFDPFDPKDKPYGHGLFPNVITNLELEAQLLAGGRAVRPSDGAEPERVAFIQCVGSRDAKIGHLWCSKFCCAATLRTARLIRHRRPDTEVTVFYIDIQTFGRDFEAAYAEAKSALRFVRAVPGDAFQVEGDGIRLTYVEDATRQATESAFDLVVLACGMAPPRGLDPVSEALGVPAAGGGFVQSSPALSSAGVFPAGALNGPMTIAEAVADARRAAWQVLEYLGRTGDARRRVAPEEPLVRSTVLPQG
jgi:heterodisulfide reductase subunit A